MYIFQGVSTIVLAESPKDHGTEISKEKRAKMRMLKIYSLRDFPGGPVGKTLHSQCRVPRFDPWSGN